MSNPGRVMFSAAEESFELAAREIRDEFGDRLEITRLGPDLGVVADPTLLVGAVAAACDDHRLVFVRHLTVETDWVPRADATDPGAVAGAALGVLGDWPDGTELALQTWTSGSAEMGYTAGELSTQIGHYLGERGFVTARSGRPLVLSIAITAAGVSIGLNRADHSLADWPGGRVRLSRDDAQISRAEFKLEELFQVFPARLPERGRALDLGASPGGWTRVLRRRGLAVCAVDPADLDPRLDADREIRHERVTAGEFLRRSSESFDLAVNDMRMDPDLSCAVMLDTVPRLRPDAPVVVTLKLGRSQPLEMVRWCLRTLAKGFVVEFARQLHHNRNELTVLARRK